MVQGNEGALTSNTVAKSRVVGVPDELRPVTVDDAGPGLDKRVFDPIEEGGVGIEIGNGDGFQLKTLAGKVRIDELFNIAIGSNCASSVEGSEICEDFAGRPVCGFVDEGLRVCEQFGDVDGLKELSWTVSTRLSRRITDVIDAVPLTGPGQKILLGHHCWVGGRAAWWGKLDFGLALGDATAVERDSVGEAWRAFTSLTPRSAALRRDVQLILKVLPVNWEGERERKNGQRVIHSACTYISHSTFLIFKCSMMPDVRTLNAFSQTPPSPTRLQSKSFMYKYSPSTGSRLQFGCWTKIFSTCTFFLASSREQDRVVR